MKADIEQDLINLRGHSSIQARRPLLVAHRGGVVAPNAPENSLAAIQLAAIHGYDMVELDVREARDGEPVLFHGTGGGSLLIDCGVERVIEDLTSDELVAIHYRASTAPIATLAQALTLCRSLNVGVMLDIKAGLPSKRYLQRVSDLLTIHQLESATVTISNHPLVREYLADRALFRVSEQDFERVRCGEEVSLHGQFWFGWARELPSTVVKSLQQNGAFVIPSINTFHYPSHARYTLARQDIRRLLAAAVDGFQIDSAYEDLLS